MIGSSDLMYKTEQLNASITVLIKLIQYYGSADQFLTIFDAE